MQESSFRYFGVISLYLEFWLSSMVVIIFVSSDTDAPQFIWEHYGLMTKVHHLLVWLDYVFLIRFGPLTDTQS